MLSNHANAKVLNVGSLNIDHVYNVRSFVQPSETISSLSYAKFAGGKGANQSVALARAGADVAHAGLIGPDGLFLKEKLATAGVDTAFIETIDAPTGHAIIQVDENGENSIILHGGANLAFDAPYLDRVFSAFGANDILLTQNETNIVPLILEKAKSKGMFVVFNPAPMTPEVNSYPLHLVDMLVINETEGAALTGESSPKAITARLAATLPSTRVALTLGADGVVYRDGGQEVAVDAHRVDVVDTTAAGDTFIGYLTAAIIADSEDMEKALKKAVRAAGICVQREGAMDSIPEIS